MNILITGGGGYLGTELVNVLMNDDKVGRVVVYDNLSRENFNLFIGHKRTAKDKFQFIQGEILDSRGLKKALDGIDTVYHLAAKVTTPFANIDSHFFEQVNHWGTAELAYALEDSKVSKVIYASSVGVYGAASKEVTEKTVPNPRTFYGTSKLRGEEHIRRLGDKMEAFVIRCGNVYGFSKSMRFDSVINKFAFDANFNNRVSIHGDGKQVRAFIHVDRLVKYLFQIATKDVPPATYNLVERNLQILDILDVYKSLVPDLEFTFINQHLSLRKVMVDTNLAIKQYIDVEEGLPLEQEIKDFLQKFAF